MRVITILIADDNPEHLRVLTRWTLELAQKELGGDSVRGQAVFKNGLPVAQVISIGDPTKLLERADHAFDVVCVDRAWRNVADGRDLGFRVLEKFPESVGRILVSSAVPLDRRRFALWSEKRRSTFQEKLAPLLHRPRTGRIQRAVTGWRRRAAAT